MENSIDILVNNHIEYIEDLYKNKHKQEIIKCNTEIYESIKDNDPFDMEDIIKFTKDMNIYNRKMIDKTIKMPPSIKKKHRQAKKK
jgi:hypothetical protein